MCSKKNTETSAIDQYIKTEYEDFKKFRYADMFCTGEVPDDNNLLCKNSESIRACSKSDVW